MSAQGSVDIGSMIAYFAKLNEIYKPTKPRRKTDRYCSFLPLNFSKYTDLKIYVQDTHYEYRPICKKYENTNNVLLFIHTVTGISSGGSLDIIQDENIEKEKDFIYIVSMDNFDQLHKKIENSTPFKIKEPVNNRRLGNCEFLDLINIKTYEWDNYLNKKDFIRYNVWRTTLKE